MINKVEEIPYGITEIATYKNVNISYQYTQKFSEPASHAFVSAARYKPYERIVAIKDEEGDEIDYISVKLPEHVFIANFYYYKDFLCMSSFFLLVIEDNKLYTPNWFNIGVDGSICWGNVKPHSQKNNNNNMKPIVDKFWNSIFTYEIGNARNDFSKNIQKELDYITFQEE